MRCRRSRKTSNVVPAFWRTRLRAALEHPFFGSPAAKGCDDGVHGLVEGGSSGGDADVAGVFKPFAAEFGGVGDPVRLAAELNRLVRKLTGVVAVAAADDDDDLAIPAKVIEGDLPLLGRATDGIDETDLGLGALIADGVDELEDAVERLGGLGDDAVTGLIGEGLNVRSFLNDGSLRVVAGHAPDFDVGCLADDDGMVALLNEEIEGVVGLADKGAGGVDDFVSRRLPAVTSAFGGAVSTDDDGASSGGVGLIE